MHNVRDKIWIFHICFDHIDESSYTTFCSIQWIIYTEFATETWWKTGTFQHSFSILSILHVWKEFFFLASSFPGKFGWGFILYNIYFLYQCAKWRFSHTICNSFASRMHVTRLSCLKVVYFCPAKDKNKKSYLIQQHRQWPGIFFSIHFANVWNSMTFPGDQLNKSSPKLYVNKTQLTELTISIKSDKCEVFLPFQAIQAVVFSIHEAKVVYKAYGAVRIKQRRGGQSLIHRRWLEAWAWLLFLCVGWKKVFKLLQSCLLSIKICHVI